MFITQKGARGIKMGKQYSRKIVRHGPGTCTISIPADWMAEQKLKLSDTLNLYEENGDLLIRGGAKHEPKSIVVELTEMQERFVRVIISKLYKNGFDEITVVYKQPKTKEIIRKEVSQNLINFSVADETDEKCILRSVATDDSNEIQNLVKRTLYTMQEVAKLLAQRPDGWLENITELEQINNQVTNYAQRLLTKFPSASTQGQSLYVATWQIEKIVDDCRSVAKKINALSQKDTKRYEESLNILFGLIEQYKTAFFSPNITVAEKFFVVCKKNIVQIAALQKDEMQRDILEIIKKLELITSILIMQDTTRIKK